MGGGTDLGEELSQTHPAVVICLPDIPERQEAGVFPANVETVLLPADWRSWPDLENVELLVPADLAEKRMLDALGTMSRLRVIQTLSAGVDRLRGRVPDGVVVCNAKGVYDGPLAEWVIGAILAVQRGLVRARDAQTARVWGQFETDTLAGRTVVILGFGSIGAALAERLRPFDAEVVGVARVARAGAIGFEGLDAVLPRADVLVNLLPLTAETDGLLDARRLGLLPDGALVVNAGRGRTTDTTALLAELERGRLSAALDVTDPEPLPPDHPLWSLSNALVSPHIAGDSRRTLTAAMALAGDQVRRFAAGSELINHVPAYMLR